MFSELKKDLKRMTHKSSNKSIMNYIELREAYEEITTDSNEREIEEIADNLPGTDINDDPNIDEVIERFIPKAKL